MKKLIPTPEQKRAIDRIAQDSSGGAIVGAEIGAGKTLITVEGALDRFATRVLTVAPLPVFENWEATFAGQTDGAVRLRPCGKTKYAGIPAKELQANLAAFMAGEDGYFFMGREFWITQDWETSERVDAKGRKRRVRKGVYAKHPVDVLIFDEAHFAADKSSRGAKTFEFAKGSYKMAVTGTFFGNTFENAWTLPHAIWGKGFTDTFALWRTRYAATKYHPHSYDHVEVTGEKDPGRWVKEMPTYLFLEGHKGEVIPEPHFVDLTPGQRRVYDQMDRDFAAKAESGDWILADLQVEARTRLRQVSIADIGIRPGTRLKDGVREDYDEVFFPMDGKSSKYDELKRLLKDHDEPVLITMDFAKAALVFTEWLKRDGISAGLWAGKKHTKDDERMRLKESFMAGDTRALVGIPAAMGTGVDGLQKICRRLYIISETQNGVEGEQLIGRLDRIGQERPVYVTNIHARGTLDVDISSGLAMQAISNAMIRELDSKDPWA